MSKERDRLAEEYASKEYERFYHHGSKYELEAWKDRRDDFKSGYDAHAEKAKELVEALEKISTARSTIGGYMQPTGSAEIAKETLTAYRGESQEGEKRE